MFYSCDTDVGSSGAPVFKVVNGEIKLIALHRGSWQGAQFNFGTLITKVIEHIKNGGPAAGECELVVYSIAIFMLIVTIGMDYNDTCSKLQSLANNFCKSC